MSTNRYKNIRQASNVTWRVDPFIDESAHYALPIIGKMNNAMKVQLGRVYDLMEHYKRGNTHVSRAVEAFVMNDQPFNNPGQLTSPADARAAAEMARIVDEVRNYNARKSTHQPYLADRHIAEFTHQMSDFRHLVLACVKYQMAEMQSAVECRSTCLDDAFYDIGAVDYCDDRRGMFDIIPVGAPRNAGCDHGYGCECGGNAWQFGETEIDHMWDAGIYVDEFHWSWELRQCQQNGGLVDRVIMKMLEIQEERRIGKQAALFGDSNGINTSIFNSENGNIVVGKNGNCHPEVCDAASAHYALESIAEQLANHKDSFGRYVCPTDYMLITPSYRLACHFKQASDLSITEHREVTDAETGRCIQRIEATSGMGCAIDVEVCHDVYLQESMQGDPNIDNTFFVVPRGTERSHVFERGAIVGFENTIIARERSRYEDLATGRPLNGWGSNPCWDEKLLFARGFGVGVGDPRLALASNGTNVACDTPIVLSATEELEAAPFVAAMGGVTIPEDDAPVEEPVVAKKTSRKKSTK